MTWTVEISGGSGDGAWTNEFTVDGETIREALDAAEEQIRGEAVQIDGIHLED